MEKAKPEAMNNQQIKFKKTKSGFLESSFFKVNKDLLI